MWAGATTIQLPQFSSVRIPSSRDVLQEQIGTIEVNSQRECEPERRCYDMTNNVLNFSICMSSTLRLQCQAKLSGEDTLFEAAAMRSVNLTLCGAPAVCVPRSQS